MKAREAVQIKFKNEIDKRYVGGVKGCPGDYFEGYIKLTDFYECSQIPSCTQCWNQEYKGEKLI